MKHIKIGIFFFLLSCTLSAQNKRDSSFYFVASGDIPCFLQADYYRFETFIKTIKELNSQFSINVLDFKADAAPGSHEVFFKNAELSWII